VASLAYVMGCVSGLACAAIVGVAHAQTDKIAPGCSDLAIVRGQPEIATEQTACDKAYLALLDEHCGRAKSPSDIAVCSDSQLRALALERKKAYDAAQARLDPDAHEALSENQEAWGASYAQACGINPKAAPPLPLARPVKECMAQAGRARLAYLWEYSGGAPNAASAKPPATPSLAAPAAPAPQPNAPAPAASAGEAEKACLHLGYLTQGINWQPSARDIAYCHAVGITAQRFNESDEGRAAQRERDAISPEERAAAKVKVEAEIAACVSRHPDYASLPSQMVALRCLLEGR